MLNKKTLIFLLFISISLCSVYGQRNNKRSDISQRNVSKWKTEMYEQYTYENIASYSPVNKVIDHNKIDIPLLNALVFFETNRQRALHDLPQLKYSPKLEASAQGHSDDMSRLNFFSHTSKVKGKENFSDRILLAGFDYSYCAENILFYYLMPLDDILFSPTDEEFVYIDERGNIIEYFTYLEMAQAMVRQWMDSPGHRKNILDTQSESLGAGCSLYYKVEGKKFKVPYIYGTQNFGTEKKNVKCKIR